MAESGECDSEICTDELATGGTEREGAGVVAYRGEEVVREWSAPAGRICSSYGAELTAMKETVDWLGGRDDWRRPFVITDTLCRGPACFFFFGRQGKITRAGVGAWPLVSLKMRERMRWRGGRDGRGKRKWHWMELSGWHILGGTREGAVKCSTKEPVRHIGAVSRRRRRESLVERSRSIWYASDWVITHS